MLYLILNYYSDDFRDFTEVCCFGDRVKHWITINEPLTYSSLGYDLGTLAPGWCSKWVNTACQAETLQLSFLLSSTIYLFLMLQQSMYTSKNTN